MNNFVLSYVGKRVMACAVAVVLSVTSLSLLPAQASMEEAFFAARNRDFKQAFVLFKAEAGKGNAEAQYRLAGMYRSGQGTAKSNDLAQKWYAKAAKQGHAKAVKKLASYKKNSQKNAAAPTNSDWQLLKAARKGELTLVRRLLKSGAKVNYQDKSGISALMEASQQGHDKVIRALLKKGAKPDLRNVDGDTALLIAASRDNLNVVRALIEGGARINSLNKKKCTPLILATYRNDLPMVQYLLSKRADIFTVNAKGRTAYEIAQGYKNEKLVRLIKKSGGRKLAKILESQVKEHSLKRLYYQAGTNQKRGWTPVMYGAWRGDKASVRAALTKKPNLETRDSTGMTALALAAQGGHLDIIYMLLDAGASLKCGENMETHPLFVAIKQDQDKLVRRLLPAITENKGCQRVLKSALSYSLLKGKMEVADLLLKAGVSFAGDKELSPLIMMAAKADDGLVTLLIRNGVDVNAVNKIGETALMLAARNGNHEGVKSLLAHNADLKRADNMGRTALIHAAQGGHVECVKYLIDEGSEIDWKTQEGNTALMLAAGRGHASVVSYLANNDNLDLKNNIGDTALIMAARAGHYEVSEILLKQGANPRSRNNKRERAQSVVKGQHGKLLALLDEYEASRSWIKDIF
ncbi:MAG TPA: hypothetical protein ENI91_03185 [Sphingomonadales bacterium]|nr:hypothetical protein [Sphingomonadales bacterium]